MGSRGPAPTPTAILKARGSWRGDCNPDEPKGLPGIPDTPFKLTGKALDHWEYLTQHLDNMDVMTKVDGFTLARYCKLYVEWVEIDEFINSCDDRDDCRNEYKLRSSLSAELLKMEQQYGLTPASRSRVDTTSSHKKETKDNSVRGMVKIGS